MHYAQTINRFGFPMTVALGAGITRDRINVIPFERRSGGGDGGFARLIKLSVDSWVYRGPLRVARLTKFSKRSGTASSGFGIMRIRRYIRIGTTASSADAVAVGHAETSIPIISVRETGNYTKTRGNCVCVCTRTRRILLILSGLAIIAKHTFTDALYTHTHNVNRYDSRFGYET